MVECQNALEAWAKRREEAWQMGWHGKEIGGELVRLQAAFAKSYAVLQKHTRECPLCEFVSKIAKDNLAVTLCHGYAPIPAGVKDASRVFERKRIALNEAIGRKLAQSHVGTDLPTG